MSTAHSVIQSNIEIEVAAFLLRLSNDTTRGDVERGVAADMFKRLPDWQTNAARNMMVAVSASSGASAKAEVGSAA